MSYLLNKISKNKFLVLILNIWCFLLNVIILSKKKTISTILFRNIDNFFINISSNSYSNISSFLNNKFKNQKIININERKEIRYYVIGVHKKFNYSYFLNWRLGKLFNFKYDENNPDYLIYFIRGNEYLNPKWNNCIKIAYFGENCIVDFEQADYGMGNHHITYLDRYFRIPLFPRVLKNYLYKYNTIDFFDIIRRRVLKNKLRTKFCAAVISNIFSDHFRIFFIEKLNLYKKVDMGGKYHNSFGGISVKDKIKFLSSYKFSIAMENTNGDGYLTEKIIESFLAGTIPIYYGDYMLDEYINPKTYILIKGFQDLDKKIEYIKKIDKNDKLYKEFLKEKVLVDKSLVEKFYKTYDEFLINIFKQEKNLARRK